MANITPLVVSGPAWDTFGTWMNTTNDIISRVNFLGTYDSINISGGTIDGTVIGGTTPEAATFTSLTAISSADFSGAILTFDSDSISGDSISGGTITVDYCELNNEPTALNHAATKNYVDTEIDTLRSEMVAYSIIFGG